MLETNGTQPESKPEFQPGSQAESMPDIQDTPPIETQNTYPTQASTLPQKGSKKVLVSVIILAIIVLVGGGVAYAYIQKIWPFAPSVYTDQNFLSGMLEKIALIESASYTVSGALNVATRDVDAKPFTPKALNSEELNRKYYYDSQRLMDATSIVSLLNLEAEYSASYSADREPKPYATSLKKLLDNNEYSYRKPSILDPESDIEYEYIRTNGGKNFRLTVNFDTDYAISAIRQSQSSATSTIISGREVIFTRNSPQYARMSSTPPEPILVSLSNSLSFLPADINAEGSISITSSIGNENTADWLFNINAEGDFGDLSYKVNADAIKKGSDYYFKINNIPSLLLFGDIGTIKGKWVSISTEVATSTGGNSFSTLSYLKESVAESDDTIKENREKFAKFIKLVVDIAADEELVYFKNMPSVDKVDGRQLIKYELSFRKDSMVPFYTRLQNEIDSDPDLEDFESFAGQGLVDYLQSDEFSEIFDYIDLNDRVIIWTDIDGFPAIIENTLRVVPPDTAKQLNDKQINIILKLSLSDINKPIEITAPADATPIDTFIEEFEENVLGSSRSKAREANIKASLSSIRAYAEIVYDLENGYGKKAFPLGPCKATNGSLFADGKIVERLQGATDDNISLATCVSKTSAGKVNSFAVSAPLPDKEGFSWCVDSWGRATEILGVIESDVCK